MRFVFIHILQQIFNISHQIKKKIIKKLNEYSQLKISVVQKHLMSKYDNLFLRVSFVWWRPHTLKLQSKMIQLVTLLKITVFVNFVQLTHKCGQLINWIMNLNLIEYIANCHRDECWLINTYTITHMYISIRLHLILTPTMAFLHWLQVSEYFLT